MEYGCMTEAELSEYGERLDITKGVIEDILQYVRNVDERHPKKDFLKKEKDYLQDSLRLVVSEKDFLVYEQEDRPKLWKFDREALTLTLDIDEHTQRKFYMEGCVTDAAFNLALAALWVEGGPYSDRVVADFINAFFTAFHQVFGCYSFEVFGPDARRGVENRVDWKNGTYEPLAT